MKARGEKGGGAAEGGAELEREKEKEEEES